MAIVRTLFVANHFLFSTALVLYFPTFTSLLISKYNIFLYEYKSSSKLVLLQSTFGNPVVYSALGPIAANEQSSPSNGTKTPSQLRLYVRVQRAHAVALLCAPNA